MSEKTLTEVVKSGELSALIPVAEKALEIVDSDDLILGISKKAMHLLRKVIKYGQLEMFIWLFENGFDIPWEIITVDPARYGQINILQWLIDTEYPLNELTCAGAAEGGHLEILKWLRSKDCPWDEETFVAAAEGGYLEIIIWARNNGCPWNIDVCTEAATHKYLDILKWLQENNCKCGGYYHCIQCGPEGCLCGAQFDDRNKWTVI